MRAQQEVILSAGAYRSPQLLMLSGVGPRDTLRDFDIPVVAARWGVGRNLQDHPQTSIAAGLHDSSDGYPKKPASYQSAAHGGFYMSSWCKKHGCTAPGICMRVRLWNFLLLLKILGLVCVWGGAYWQFPPLPPYLCVCA